MKNASSKRKVEDSPLIEKKRKQEEAIEDDFFQQPNSKKIKLTQGRTTRVLLENCPEKMTKEIIQEILQSSGTVLEIYDKGNGVISVTMSSSEEAQIVSDLPLLRYEDNILTIKLDMGLACFLCGEFGHFGKDCPGKKMTTNCFLCGEKGHMAMECKNNKTNNNNNNNNKPKEEKSKSICFKCGKSGHISKLCGEDRAIDRQTKEMDYKTQNNEHVYDPTIDNKRDYNDDWRNNRGGKRDFGNNRGGRGGRGGGGGRGGSFGSPSSWRSGGGGRGGSFKGKGGGNYGKNRGGKKY